jgi:thioredoxin 1
MLKDTFFMTTTKTTDATFAADVLQATTPVLVDFWGHGCPPCTAIAPVLEEVAADFAGRVKIVKACVDDAMEMAGKYRIRAVPTLLLFKNGEVASMKMGFQSKVQLTEWLNSL